VTVSIHQPNYLPWLGFFHKMALCDVFVLLDDVQFPRNKSYCSRVKIKTSNGPYWLSIPVKEKRAKKKINEIEIVTEEDWRNIHWRTLKFSYKNAPYFSKYAEFFENVYNKEWRKLIDVNVTFIKLIKNILGIKTKLIFSSEISDPELKGANKIFNILDALNAEIYISGKGEGAQRYINLEEFKEKQIKLIYQNFKHPIYKQLFGTFKEGLSIIDFIFNCGHESFMNLVSCK